jgi:hypothetical protein
MDSKQGQLAGDMMQACFNNSAAGEDGAVVRDVRDRLQGKVVTTATLAGRVMTSHVNSIPCNARHGYSQCGYLRVVRGKETRPGKKTSSPPIELKQKHNWIAA